MKPCNCINKASESKLLMFFLTLHPDNINSDSGMEIPVGGISMVENHSNKRVKDN